MRKITKRRILSSVLSVVVGLSSIGLLKTGTAVYASPSVNDGRSSTDSKTWISKSEKEAYDSGMVDYFNGETVLKSSEKANILRNIKEDGEYFDILEIVPFELASQFNVLVPDEDDEDRIAKYGSEIVSQYNTKKGTSESSITLSTTDNDFKEGIGFNDTGGDCLKNTLDISVTTTVSNSFILANAERISILAAKTADQDKLHSDDSQDTYDAVIESINNALTSSGIGVTAVWKDQTSKTVTLTSAADGSTEDITVSFAPVTSDSADEVAAYIDSYIELNLLINNSHDIYNPYGELHTYLTNAYNSIKSYCPSYTDYSLSSGTRSVENGVVKYTYGFSINKYTDPAVTKSVENTVELLKSGDGYVATMENYYLDMLFDGMLQELMEKYGEDSNKYKAMLELKEYFASEHRVRVHTVVASQITGSSFEYDDDKVDMIYVTNSVKYSRAIIYRNAFMSGKYITSTDVDDAEKNAKFLLYGTDADNIFHTGVFKKDDETVEYKLSELLNGNVGYGDVLIEDAAGNKVDNSMSFEQVRTVLAYVFGGTNQAMRGQDLDGSEKMFRVPVMFELTDTNNSAHTDNIFKLYYLLCKSTDEPGTYALDKNISTYYGDPNYFLTKYAEYIVPSDVAVYANYVSTMGGFSKLENSVYEKYQGVDSSSSSTGIFNTDLDDDTKEKIKTAYENGGAYVLHKSFYFYLMSLNKNDWNNNYYQIYNGVIGIDTSKNDGYPKMIYDPLASFGSNNDPTADYRLDSKKGSFYLINDYLLGLDVSDYLLAPEAKFTHAQQGDDASTKNEAQRISGAKKPRLKPDPTFVDTDPTNTDAIHGRFTINYQDVIYNLVDDTTADQIKVYFYGSIIKGAGTINTDDCKLNTIIDGNDPVAALAGTYSITATETSGSDVIKVAGWYEIQRDTDIYTAFNNHQLKLQFVVDTTMKMDEIKYSVIATTELKFVDRKVHDLD